MFAFAVLQMKKPTSTTTTTCSRRMSEHNTFEQHYWFAQIFGSISAA